MLGSGSERRGEWIDPIILSTIKVSVAGFGGETHGLIYRTKWSINQKVEEKESTYQSPIALGSLSSSSFLLPCSL
jgi:hypothetical protein